MGSLAALNWGAKEIAPAALGLCYTFRVRNPDAYTDSVDADYLYLYYRKCTLEVRIKERQNRIVWISLWIWHHFKAYILFIKK